MEEVGSFTRYSDKETILKLRGRIFDVANKYCDGHIDSGIICSDCGAIRCGTCCNCVTKEELAVKSGIALKFEKDERVRRMKALAEKAELNLEVGD